MPVQNNVSAKIRSDDHEAIQGIAAEFGSDGIHIISAMRRLWESSSEKKRVAAIKRVNSPEPEPSQRN